MYKYAAQLSYVGTRYCGWQTQKGSAAQGGPSIQTTVAEVLHKITGEKVSVVGSGRTDSGVHALGQVIHFVLKEKEWDPKILFKALNSVLPGDISVRAICRVPIEFHAQRSAVGKQYGYYFQQGPCGLPHLDPFSWWIRKPLDVKAMNEAVGYLVGEHDFLPFRASGAKPGTTVRKILEAEVVVEPLAFPGKGLQPAVQLVRLRIVGTGFLKQMVRGIAGTLLQVGDGRRAPDCMKDILRSQDRKEVGPTAPARALWLERVWYDEPNLTFGD